MTNQKQTIDFIDANLDVLGDGSWLCASQLGMAYRAFTGDRDATDAHAARVVVDTIRERVPAGTSAPMLHSIGGSIWLQGVQLSLVGEDLWMDGVLMHLAAPTA